MLYHLFQYLDRSYDLPGAGMFQYISFRSALAVILALLITITFGQGIIRFMQRRQIGEEIRNLGLEGQLQKRGTPTMGGVMILLAVLVPVLLFGRLDNIYIQLMIVSTVWLGLLGFLDDYIKVFRHNKEGLKGKFKIVGQVGIGIIVGTVMCASPEVVVRDKVVEPVQQLFVDDDGEVIESVTTNRVVMGTESVKTTQTTIPFVKNNEFDYAWFTGGNRVATWILYVLVAIFVVTAVSNGANLTDGLDGLVSGRLPQYHVYPRFGRTGGLRGCLRRRTDRFPVVQLVPGSDLHGRYGVAGHRRHHRRFRPLHPQGIVAADPLRRVFCRESFGYDTGLLFQIYQTPLRRGTAHLPDVAHPPPLSEEGNLRDEDRHPLLDREHAAVARGARDAQNPIIKPKNDE